MASQLYDRIGEVYTSTRRADARIAEMIWRGLGDANTVVNVGAGAGSYEPPDRRVVAVEPSWRMIQQRSGSAPVVCGVAESLPFPAGAFDAALAILTLHHWTDWRRGLTEMKRVATRQVLVAFDPDEVRGFWLTASYLPEIGELDRGRCPPLADIARALGPCRVQSIAVPYDCTDGFLAAYWRRPEAYLEPSVRAGISSFALLDPAVVTRGVARLRSDVDSGVWDERFGHLRKADALDVGYRLVIRG
jgi:SAM-dependent methyltransferase